MVVKTVAWMVFLMVGATVCYMVAWMAFCLADQMVVK